MNYKKWLKLNEDAKIYDFRNKGAAVDTLVTYMLNRTQRMFEYDGLPDSMPSEWVEKYLQTNGNIYIPRETWDNKHYAFTGGLGGAPDPYYFPTVYTIANPALGVSKEYNIQDDGVLIKNDAYMVGLLPLFTRYATLLMENEISLYVAMINSRAAGIVSASDDATKASADLYFDKLEKGELSVIAESAFLDGVRSQPFSGSASANTIQNLIELEQYIRATWYSEVGLKTNYNMKREALNSNETGIDNDILLPLVDDMLQQRKDGWARYNEITGENVQVRLSSSWRDNQKEADSAAGDNKEEGEKEDGETENTD